VGAAVGEVGGQVIVLRLSFAVRGPHLSKGLALLTISLSSSRLETRTKESLSTKSILVANHNAQ